MREIGIRMKNGVWETLLFAPIACAAKENEAVARKCQIIYSRGQEEFGLVYASPKLATP